MHPEKGKGKNSYKEHNMIAYTLSIILYCGVDGSIKVSCLVLYFIYLINIEL
jgi:hypothetical protein